MRPGRGERIALVRRAIAALGEKEQLVIRVTFQWYRPEAPHQRLSNEIAAELAATLQTTPENLRLADCGGIAVDAAGYVAVTGVGRAETPIDAFDTDPGGIDEDAFVLKIGPPPDGDIAATGDFTGDGKADILLRNKHTARVGYWPMNYSTKGQYAELGVA